MMNSRILRVGTGLAFALTAVACNSDTLTNLNTNPNSPEDVQAGPLFTYATRIATSRWLGSGYDLRETEWVAQHLGEIQYTDEDRYTRLHAGDTQANWNNAYSGEMKDFNRVVDKGTASGAPGTFAPAQVMLSSDISPTLGEMLLIQRRLRWKPAEAWRHRTTNRRISMMECSRS